MSSRASRLAAGARRAARSARCLRCHRRAGQPAADAARRGAVVPGRGGARRHARQLRARRVERDVRLPAGCHPLRHRPGGTARRRMPSALGSSTPPHTPDWRGALEGSCRSCAPQRAAGQLGTASAPRLGPPARQRHLLHMPCPLQVAVVALLKELGVKAELSIGVRPGLGPSSPAVAAHAKLLKGSARRQRAPPHKPVGPWPFTLPRLRARACSTTAPRSSSSPCSSSPSRTRRTSASPTRP